MRWGLPIGRHDPDGLLLPDQPDAYEVSMSSYWNIGVMPRPKGLRRLWLRLRIWWINFTDQWEPLAEEPEPIEEEEIVPDDDLEPDPTIMLEAECSRCGYQWLARFFRGTPKLQCKQCGGMTAAPPEPAPVTYENEELTDE